MTNSPAPEAAPEGESQPPTIMENARIQQIELKMKLESMLLKTKPFILYRWLACSLIAGLFVLRMFVYHRYYTIGYIAGLYIMNCMLLFVSPKLDPELEKDSLPSAEESSNNRRPFVRKLPEFLFWQRTFFVSIVAHIASIFPVFDPPTYGPLLFVYFLIVTFLSFRERIFHMIRNHYVPFDFGKPKFTKDND